MNDAPSTAAAEREFERQLREVSELHTNDCR